jgi:hypothetical protein
MADIKNQGKTPFEKKWKKFLPSLEELQVGTKYAKKLGTLPAYLNSQLLVIKLKLRTAKIILASISIANAKMQVVIKKLENLLYDQLKEEYMKEHSLTESAFQDPSWDYGLFDYIKKNT